ncbi:hypothetical protein J1605_002681 [Eschrichtius robustus]|uniref:Uncharacterized protein n=1 Tax=Eschrichtius robustus TaxID=9764 RepID=A0AB34HZW5_ESCRO|nr:hypothetical protein J1605_002681 [Eschrichtius robustus]
MEFPRGFVKPQMAGPHPQRFGSGKGQRRPRGSAGDSLSTSAPQRASVQAPAGIPATTLSQLQCRDSVSKAWVPEQPPWQQSATCRTADHLPRWSKRKLRAGPKADWRLKCLHREEARFLVVESPLAPLATLHGISVLPPSSAGTSQGSHSSLRSEGFLSLPGAGQQPSCHVSSPSSWTSKTQAGGLPGTVGKDPSHDPTQRTKPSGSSRWEV